MKKIVTIIKKNFVLVCMLIIALMRFYLVERLPIMAYPTEVYDDQLMVELTKNIIEGKWLGDYDSNTFIKRPGFPMFLAFLKNLNLSFLFSLDILYILSCFYFMYSIKDDIKNGILKIIIFSLMIFNPISYASWTFQRVYRNGAGLFQTIFVFSGMYILFKKRKEPIKKLMPHIILISTMLSLIWHSREDSIWVLPFIIVATFLIILFNIIEEKIKRKTILKAITVCVPIICVGLSGIGICLLNYKNYGVFAETEVYYNKVLSSLYKVKANDEIQYVDNTRNKILELYEVSETLASIKPQLEASLDIWSKYDRHPDDNEVENGWFSWAFKDAVESAGYYKDAKTSNEFHKKIYEEIERALEEGKLEKQDGMLISSLPAWREEYFSQICKRFGVFFKFVCGFDKLYATNDISIETSGIADLKISDFEFVTNEFAVDKSRTNVRICGWYFLNNGEEYKLYLENEKNQKISEINRMPSQDISQVFGLNVERTDRFDFVAVDIEKTADFNNLYISVYNSKDELVEKIDLKSYIPNVIFESEISKYSLSLVSIETKEDPVKTYSQSSVYILNKITSVYQKIGIPVTIIAVISYIALMIKNIGLWIKNKKIPQEFNICLILTGILLSFILVLLGIIYTDITFCSTLIYMYLVVSYPLMMMFVTVAISYLIQETVKKIKKRCK